MWADWFGRKAARAEARPVLGRTRGDGWTVVDGLIAGAATATPVSYEARVRAAYGSNPVAQRAVRLIAEGAGGAPLKTGSLADLVSAPSAGQGLLETLATHLLLHGDAYVQLIASDENDGRPSELYALRPERVTLETDARGWPAAYHYRAGESRTRLPAEQVVALRLPDPLEDHRGLGCLAAAAPAVALHNEATRWNLNLLANAARPSGALSHEGKEALTGEQFERLRGELESAFQGAGHAGRPLLLEGGLRWQALSLTPADMDFEALKAAAARDIALAFGVPPMLLGLPGDSTYANYREANRALWRLTLLPLLDKMLGGLGHALGRWWPGEPLAVDVDRVPALSEDRERLWRQVSGADFLSGGEKRMLLGIDPGVPSPRSPAGESPSPAGGREVS